MGKPAKVIPIHRVEGIPEEVPVSSNNVQIVGPVNLRKNWHPPKIVFRVGILCERKKTSCASWHNDHNCYGATCPFRDQ
jgi:hypothetical protein